jgi:undecaprenyl-diphosphatase
MLVVKAVVLGIVEGLTEFLPVSSTGHLIIAGDALDFNDERAKTFEVFIQLGAILAVAWLYRTRLLRVVHHFGRPEERRFVLNLLIAFLPAAITGFLFHGYIKEYLFKPVTVAVALIVGGAVILLIERFPRPIRVADVDAMGPADALKVGIAQTLSLVPGVSRAGATIMGGLLSGLSRTAATEFSFFLAIPTMLAATMYDLAKNYKTLVPGDTLLFAVGFITAFVSAVIVVKLFIAYVSRHDFTPFAIYRIGFGFLVLWYFV